MRNLAAKFGKIFDICKKFSKNLVDERGNMPRRGVVPRFSDLEVIALSLTAEQFGVDSVRDIRDPIGSAIPIESKGLETNFCSLCQGKETCRNAFLTDG